MLSLLTRLVQRFRLTWLAFASTLPGNTAKSAKRGAAESKYIHPKDHDAASQVQTKRQSITDNTIRKVPLPAILSIGSALRAAVPCGLSPPHSCHSNTVANYFLKALPDAGYHRLDNIYIYICVYIYFFKNLGR